MSTDGTSLEGKVALVTGASRGIGAAIARAFAEHGARVAITARHGPELEETAKAIGASAFARVAHAGDPDQARECVAATLEHFGRLDVLVNNAGTNPHFGRMIDADLPRYDKTMEVNVRGPLAWTQEAWRQAMQAGGGCVVNVASVSGIEPGGPLGIYGVSKAALIHLTKHLATEMGPRVRVNAIAPGLVKTEFARALWEPHEPSAPWPWPLARLGTPEDVAGVALFLASDLASWVTGHVLVVDGGQLLGTGGVPTTGSSMRDATA